MYPLLSNCFVVCVFVFLAAVQMTNEFLGSIYIFEKIKIKFRNKAREVVP